MLVAPEVDALLEQLTRRGLGQTHKVGVVARHVAKRLTPIPPQVFSRCVFAEYVAHVVVNVPARTLAKRVSKVPHNLGEAIRDASRQQRAETNRRNEGPLLP